LGKKIAVVGLSAGIIATTTACEAINDFGTDKKIPGMITTTSKVSSTYVLDGDIDIGGVPMPPVTTDDVPELGGEPLPVYYLTEFTLYDTERLYRILQSFNLYDVVEGEEGPSGVWESAKEEEIFVLLGDNATDQHEAYIYLIRYQDELYAIDAYDLEHFADEILVDAN
jgi:hypothetical protein